MFLRRKLRMTLDITSMRRQLREHLGIEGDATDELPDTDSADKTGCDTYLNRSWWESNEKFKFREKETTGTFPTVVGVKFYQVPFGFESIQHISIEDPDSSQHTPLDRITKDVFEQKYVNRTDAQGKPELYFRESNGIRLWPVPDQIYTLTLSYLSTLADLSGSNATPSIPQAWHEIILFGGVWRAFLGVTRDFEGSQNARAYQTSLIAGIEPTEEKEMIDSHRSGLEVLGRDGEL